MRVPLNWVVVTGLAKLPRASTVPTARGISVELLVSSDVPLGAVLVNPVNTSLSPEGVRVRAAPLSALKLFTTADGPVLGTLITTPGVPSVENSRIVKGPPGSGKATVLVYSNTANRCGVNWARETIVSSEAPMAAGSRT